MKTSPRCVRFPNVPDDNSGTDEYHKRGNDEGKKHGSGGAVVALSLGLASVGTGTGLTASESTPTHAQPEELVGGGGGSGGEVVTYFSASFVQNTYDWEQGFAPSIGSTLCNHMTPYNAAAVSYCQDNVSVSLGHAIDLACAPGSNCPEVALTYDANGDVWYSIF